MVPIMNFDWDIQMFQAISRNDLYTVHRLISSGIGVNSVLHNPDRRDSTTILSEAAYAGRLDIVQYLVNAGALINHKDPCFGRTPLHWACMGHQRDVAIYLIEHGADVNCVDRDNVTPILFAAMRGCDTIVTCLIKNGANPHKVDRLRSSALHYATFHGHPAVVSRLIEVGCIPNNKVIFGQGTPLANLVHNKDYANCRLLLESGYDLKNEDYLHKYNEMFIHSTFSDESGENVTDTISQMNNIVQWLKTPRSLQCFCRTVIRNRMRGSYLQERINSLPIPSQLKRYLLFL